MSSLETMERDGFREPFRKPLKGSRPRTLHGKVYLASHAWS